MKIRSGLPVWVQYAILGSFLLLYLPSLGLYFVHPGQWWPMGILSIGFPMLWLSCSLLAIAGFLMRQRVAWWLAGLFLTGFYIGKNVLATNYTLSWQMTKDTSAIRVLQWNCANFGGDDPGFEAWRQADRMAAVNLIKTNSPDIICLQDFNTYDSSAHVRSNIALFADTLGYRYYHFAVHFSGRHPWGRFRTGNAIFSKTPFLAQGSINLEKRVYPANLLYADLLWQGRKLRVATTHFASMHLKWDKSVPLNARQLPDSAIIRSSNTIRKLRYFQPQHVQQAKQVRQFLDTCPMPVVLCADLNSMPSSWVYNTVRGPFKDAFLDRGRGIGKSFKTWVPFLRIDFLFFSPGMQALQCSNLTGYNSDHHPVIADLIFP